MEVVLVTLLVGWAMTRYGITDALAAARGTESPRVAERRQRSAQAHQRQMARMRTGAPPTVAEALGQRIADRIANPRGRRPPGPFRRFAAQWWDDCWNDATARHQDHRDRAARGELPRQRFARAAAGWVRGRRAGGAPRPRRPAGRQAGGVVDGEVVDGPSHWPSPAPLPLADRPHVTETADPADPTEQGQQRTDTSGDEPLDPIPTGPIPAGPIPAGPIPAGPVPAAEPAQSRPAPDPTGDPVVQHDPHDSGDPMASVNPIEGDQTMTSPTSPAVPGMTEINGETLDPQAALTFVTSLKELADSIVGQLELSVATLSGRGVAGEPIDLLTSMQEAFTTASGQCETAKGHFERHLATQDVVLGDDTLARTVENTYVGSAS